MRVNKFSHVRFKPAGLTQNPKIRIAKSIVDYMFRWFAAKFLSPDAQFEAGVNIKTEPEEQLTLDDTTGDGGDATRNGAAGGGDKAAHGMRHAIQNDAGAPPVRDLRRHHDPQRRLLQVRQLRSDERLRLSARRIACKRIPSGLFSQPACVSCGAPRPGGDDTRAATT